MALSVLGVAIALMLPVAVGWKVALGLLQRNPTPAVKAFFWAMSGLFVALAAAAFAATRFIE